MKKVLSIILVCSFIISMFVLSSAVNVGAEPTDGQVLVWSDEFDGTSLDTGNWVYDVGYGYWGNNELEYYRSGTNNIVVEDGALAITAKKESYGGASYTSGRITTCNKQSFQYGTIEARIKMPVGQGLWPAFWMLSNSASWPDGGEIDIMEHINSETIAYGTAHDWNGGDTKSLGGSFYNIDVTQYHVYTIQWTEEYIKWFIDDTQYYEVDISTDSTFFPNIEVFHEPYYLLLNVAVGGTWPGDPVDSSFPGTMYVDYVRVYQDSDDSTTTEPDTDTDTTADVFVFKLNDTNVLYANQNMKFAIESPATLVDGKTLVPLRAIGSAVGIEDLTYTEATSKITFTGFDGYKVEMTIGSTVCTLTKDGTSMDITITAPVIINGVTMLPLRDATNLVGGTVKFDDLGTTDTGYVVVSGGTFEDADVAGYIEAYEA